ncbi:MAG: homogentisate 1,2-dioxygenase [Kiloniellaceae bacterium]
MKHWIALPRIEGTASRQAHADLPPGTYERELGREGFFGPATQMYHTHPPTGWIDWQGPLRPRAFDLSRIETPTTNPWEATEVLHSAHVRTRFWRTEGRMGALARNGDGDELMFVHRGRGDLFCDYGHLAIAEGDYVVVPRGTMWRTEFDGPAALLLIEATGAGYGLPDKGLAGPHAIFDPAVFDTPAIDEAFRAQQTPEGREEAWRVLIKRRGAISTVTYPFNPLDAVGWHGNLAPVRLNVRDIRPLMSHRYHLPPSAHTTFVADRFVICTFVPRPFETDPGALKVPFFHSNDDYDEVIFYHRGDFFSRDNIGEGMVTFHPCGFTHGPHPKALQGALTPTKAATDEVAVMLDARDPLEVAPLPEGVEVHDYVDSWRGGRDTAAAE